MDDHAGQRYGDYRLIRFLGRGGFGKVYLGENVHNTTQQAAVKVLTTLSLDKKDLSEFLNEARTFKLKHRHIVELLDFGIGEDDTPYLVMAYAPNGTLRQRHSKGSVLPIETIISYVKPIAEALQYAHEQRLIHRDVKPENMLLGPQNEIWLSDFGTAVAAHSTRSQILQENVGTVSYMAPEQIQGKPQPASDQYALGVVVYEWLSGTCPFEGTTGEIINQHLYVSPSPLCTKVPTVSPQVEQVVLKALAKDPQLRFASVKEFADALEHVSVSSQTSTTILPAKQAIPTIEPTVPAIPQSQTPGLDALYREGAITRAKGDLPNLERTVSYWQQILDADPNYQNGTLAEQMRRLKKELEPLQRNQRRQETRQEFENSLQQAKEAVQSCDWQRVIDTYNTVLYLLEKVQKKDSYNMSVKQISSIKRDAGECIEVAKHNLRYAWIYENARQLVKEGRLDAGKTALQELWHDAPYYGDPAGLAKQVGLLKHPGYKQLKYAQRKVGTHLYMIFWWVSFYLVAGLSATIGILTQSWPWAIAAVVIFSLYKLIELSHWDSWSTSNRRERINFIILLMSIAMISIPIAFILTRFASSYPSTQIAWRGRLALLLLSGMFNMVCCIILIVALFFLLLSFGRIFDFLDDLDPSTAIALLPCMGIVVGSLIWARLSISIGNSPLGKPNLFIFYMVVAVVAGMDGVGLIVSIFAWF